MNLVDAFGVKRFRLIYCVMLGCAFSGAGAAADGALIANRAAAMEDPRHERLEAFFQSYGCPAPHHVSEYLGAADAHAVDYRLLPAISLLESTCGIHQRLNNRWGWDSARRGFSSFKAGLEYIARQLATGHFYKNKTLDEKIHMYNPKPQYAQQLKQLMRKIDDSSVLDRPAASSATQISLDALANTRPNDLPQPNSDVR